MQPELVDDRLDLGEVSDLMNQRLGVIAQERRGTARQDLGRQSVEERSFSGGTRGRCPWCARVARRTSARWVV